MAKTAVGSKDRSITTASSADSIGLNLRLIRSSSILPHGSRSFAATAFLIRRTLPSHLLHCGLGQKTGPSVRLPMLFQPFPAFLSRADLPPPVQPRRNRRTLHNVILTKQSFIHKYFTAILPLHFLFFTHFLCKLCNFLVFPPQKSDFRRRPVFLPLHFPRSRPPQPPVAELPALIGRHAAAHLVS